MSFSAEKEITGRSEAARSYLLPAPVAQPAPQVALQTAPTAPASMQSAVGNAAFAGALNTSALTSSNTFELHAAYGNGAVAEAAATTLPLSAGPKSEVSELPQIERPGGDKQASGPNEAKTRPQSPSPIEKPEKEAQKQSKKAPAEKNGAAGKAEVSEKAPEAATVPDAKEAIGPTIGAVQHRAVGARKHRPAKTAVDSAQASAIEPDAEQTRLAAATTVRNLDAADTEQVRRAEFKAKLKKAINDATPQPKSEAEADQVMKTGATTASTALREQLATESDAAAGPMKSAALSEVSPSEQPAPPKTELSPEQVGAAPAPVSAAPVVPAPLSPERLDYSSDRAPTDQAMSESGVTNEQLEKGNEPEFGPAVEARATAEEHEATAEGRYRESESKVQDQAYARAQGSLGQGLAGVRDVRALQIGEVVGQQVGTADKNAAERKRITEQITGIKDKTRDDVGKTLEAMEIGATALFEAGLKDAEQAYEDTFDEAKGGVGTWLTTWGDDWEELIEDSLEKARTEYLRRVDVAIDQVADLVDAKLTEAKNRVAHGRTQVDDFVKGLDDSVRKYGEEALQAVSEDFDAMGEEIDQRRDTLINKLAEQYKASYERMSAKEEALREANKSLWQRVYDATLGLIQKIIAFKDMLLGVLSKAADLIGSIIADPIGFLGNMVSAIMQGLENFIAKIDIHLQKGIMEWLFGALAGAGLQLPEKFDLEGIVSIVLQILGLTYANIRSRAVAIVGEPIVAALEQGAEVFKVIMTEGVPGLWRFIKDQVADLKAMVLDAIFEFIRDRVINAGIMWIIGLLNPVSAFFKACKAIYDIVMFFVRQGSQILALVNAVIDSIGAIAKGALGQAAAMVEGALAKTIPVAIGFLASLLGLGDPSAPVKDTIEKARSPVNKAIDWVIGMAVKGVKAAGAFLKGVVSGNKKSDSKEGEANSSDPAVGAKVAAANAFIDQQEAELGSPDEISEEQAQQVVTAARENRELFKSISVARVGKFWEYSFTVNPTIKKDTPAKPKFSETDDEQNLKDLELGLDTVPHPPPDEPEPAEVAGPTFADSRRGNTRIWSLKGGVKAWRFYINEGRFNAIRDKKGNLESEWWNTVPGQESAKRVLEAEERGRDWLSKNYDHYLDMTPESKTSEGRTAMQKVSTPGIDVPALGTVTNKGANAAGENRLGRTVGEEALLVGEAKHSDYPTGRNFTASEPSVIGRTLEVAKNQTADVQARVEAALAAGNIVYTIFLSGGARFSTKQIKVLTQEVKSDLRQYLRDAGYTKEEINDAVKNVIVRTQAV